MTFREDAVEDFLAIFEDSKEKIREFDGCNHLELLRDYTNPSVFITYSKWNDESALNTYRTSPLFDTVWTETKRLFKEKPVAFSMKEFMQVP
jgi:quinol monooxygenase YgiN